MNLKKKLDELLEKNLSDFVCAMADDEVENINFEEDEKRFDASEYNKNFNKEATKFLLELLRSDEINDSEFEDAVKDYGLKIDENELKSVLQSKIDKPKPSVNAPEGKEYVWSEADKQWVLVDKV